MKHTSQRRRLGAVSVRNGGFSLAEVLIAMAITAFAILALVGALPDGLSSLQDAEMRSAEARIVQYLTAQCQLREMEQFGSGSDIANEDFYFDARGAPTEHVTTETVYQARCRVESALPMPGEASASPFLDRLRIRITRHVNIGAGLEDPNKYRERHVTIARMDRGTAAAGGAPPPDTTEGGSAP